MKLKFLKRFFRRKEPLEQGGAILDRVISQSTPAANTCLLYKLANYKRGGDLIDAFQIGGQMAVEQLIREQFGVFMYQSGKGQVINRAEYLRWKYMDNHEVTIPIEASLSPHDPLGKWTDHKACWQMQYRGSLGESLLHVLIICDTKIHTKLARILLRVFPQQSIDVMEGEDYLGASALHLAIAYSNNELVQDLIEAGADVNQRAIGSFFLPRDQQGYKPAKNSDYEGLAYLGEYPLAWAACCANESVYNLLLDNNADPNAQDTFGNMILHMVVVCDKLDMFGYALRHPKLPAKNGMLNTSGLTPLTLACKLGRAEVFREMLELSSREFWRYSNITCSGYPLNALDTLMPDGSTNWNSALFIILNGTKEEHLDMLDGGIIQRLLEEKWKTFARRQFLKRLLILFIHLFCMSCSIYLRPSSLRRYENNDDDSTETLDSSSHRPPSTNEHEVADENDVSQIIRYCAECATILGVLSYVIFQQGDEMKNQGVVAFLKQLSHDPAKSIFLISNLMILGCIPFRIMGDVETEEAILVFAVPGSWFLLMFFAGAIRLTGPFVTMIYSMITGDMLTFGIIYTIVLFGFSQAFYFLYKGHPNVESTPFHTYYSTWMALFQTTLGDYNYADLNNTSYPNLGKTVFVIFMIFVPILLLNMLIAMMGNTYAHVIEQSEKEWMKQWAKIVVALERAVSQADAKKYLEDYSISLGPSDDPRYEQRGVMVIKSKSKTRAKQRKGAVSNWKRVGKVTLNALHKRGMTGEQLRRVMWGRTSITSPTRVTKKKPSTLNDPFGITTAIDGMSFTHDIIMCGSDKPEEMHATIELPGDKNNKKKKIELKAGNYNPVIAGQNSSFPVRTGQIDGKELMMTSKLQQELDQKVYNDPLRELVLISEAFVPRDTQYYNNVLMLAQNATALDHVQEVKFGDKLTALGAPPPIAPNLNQQINLFQNPNEIVDPVKEREFLKTLEALDDTDNELSEKPVLGKISLLRRAKSAVSRTSSAKQKTTNHPLFLMNWDEITLTKQTAWPENDVENEFAEEAGGDDGIVNNGYVEEAGIVAENEAIPQDEDNVEEPKVVGVSPPAEPEDSEVVTVEDVRRCMERFHRQRKSSADSESTDRELKKRRPTNGKFSKNKISPESSVDKDEKKKKPGKRGKSAPIQEFRRRLEAEMTDPLENWSTKNIMSISRLLED